MNLLRGYQKVKPIIIYPKCLKEGRKQDCFNCDLFKSNKCISPRSLCVKAYPGHKKGCPNYGKLDLCPPNVGMIEQIYDLTKDIYCIYIAFDLASHVKKMKQKHPNWNDRQLRNLLYWQGTAKKMLREEVKKFLSEYESLGYKVISSPEAMGVDVTKTLKQIGIILEWSPVNKVYKVTFAGVPKNDNKE